MMCSDFGFAQSGGTAYTISFAISLPTTSSASTTIPYNTWTHIVGTYDGSYIRIYKNGSLAGQTYHPGIVANLNRYLEVGGWGAPSWNGWIDDLRIYDRVLGSSEIAALYNWRGFCSKREGLLSRDLGRGRRDGGSSRRPLVRR